MILADHGADVVKIENPKDGDQLRKTPPFQEGESAPFMLCLLYTSDAADE